MKGQAAAKVEGLTVAWAVLSDQPARVVSGTGKVLGEMVRLGDDGLQLLALQLPNFTAFPYRIEAGQSTKAGGMIRIEHIDYPPESLPSPQVPQGRLETFQWSQSHFFPDTLRDVTVYLPAQWQPYQPACLMVWQDGSRHAERDGQLRAPNVMDHLIHDGRMPVTIGVFVDPGRRADQKPDAKAANRSFEYDSLGDAYVRFLEEEILPAVAQRYGITWVQEPSGRAIAGGSSGGICAFTAAWERPHSFGKVLSWVGSFVDLKGGHAYPSLIRTTEPKPIRVYLLAGENDLDNPFGHWPTANKQMQAALAYSGYDHHLEWTQCFHGTKGMAPQLADALTWLWRDWRSDLKVATQD